MITGKFKSAFGTGAPADSSTGKGHVAEAANDVAVLVIADTDFLFDGNAIDRIQFGPQVILRPKNDNVNFLANAVETLGGNMDLISIRSRGRIARPFTKVQEIQVDAQKRYQEEEQRLSNRINELQKELNDIQAQRAGGSRFTLSNEQQVKIDSFRAEEKAARERRREVRKGLREDIEKLGKRLVAANMLMMPFGIGAFGVVMHINRGRRRKKGE
jgi:ABC-2 type transport system permease protein